MTVRAHGWPGEPVDPPPPKPPKSQPTDPRIDLPLQTSEMGVAIPIVYGTVRIGSNLIERVLYSFQSPGGTRWIPSHAYVLNDIVVSNGSLYICTQAGTSASSGGPIGTGTGQVDNTARWDYTSFGYRHLASIGLCEGQIFGAGKAWVDKTFYAAYTDIPHEPGFIFLNNGTPTGGRPVGWPFFPPSNDPYGNTAVLYVYFVSKADVAVPQVSIEIKGIFADGTHTDANPSDIGVDLLTHARRGAAWPTASVDAVSTGSGNAASWKNYCQAAALIVSWSIDEQTSGLELLKLLLAVSNTDSTMTNRLDGLGWMIKFVPRGTDAITANGTTFTPNLTPAYVLTPDDFLDAIQIDGVAPTDTFNSFPVQFIERARDYASRVVDDPDMADVDVRGLARASTSVYPMVMAPDAAIQLSRIKAQQSLNIANTYRMKLGFRFLLVEPTDLLTATDGLIGINGQPVRVVTFEEDQSGDGAIMLDAEDFPANVGAAKSYAPQTGDGFVPQSQTPITALQVLPGQVGTSAVPDGSSTRGGSVDNIWPNPTSEDPPPDGADLTRAEWIGRVFLGIGTAPAGGWVRSPGTGANLSIPFEVPAIPGETYYMEAQVAAAVAGANKGGFVKIVALDSLGASLGSASSPSNDTVTFGAKSTQFVMPSGTTKVQFSLVNGTDAAAHAYFDTILARRSIDLKLFAVEPWAATRLVTACSVTINAAGTVAAYIGGGTPWVAGFDPATAPTLVTVGAEPQPRLRLKLLALPNGLALGTHVTKFFAHAHRSQAIGANIPFPSAQLILLGWNFPTREFDFWLGSDDWSVQVGGVNQDTPIFPMSWAFGNAHNWDITLTFVTDLPFKFF